MRTTDTISVVSPSLIGRETELAILNDLLNQTASGVGRIVRLAGEAGIGKSCLAEEVKSVATQHGFRIAQGRCFEQDRTFPYAPLVDLLRGFCSGRSTDELTVSFGPTAIDDLHRCDDTSLEWLLYLARQMESQPILVVLTYRDDEIQLPNFTWEAFRSIQASTIQVALWIL